MKKEKIITVLSENELDIISGGTVSGSQELKKGFFQTLGRTLAEFCIVTVGTVVFITATLGAVFIVRKMQ